MRYEYCFNKDANGDIVIKESSKLLFKNLNSEITYSKTLNGRLISIGLSSKRGTVRCHIEQFPGNCGIAVLCNLVYCHSNTLNVFLKDILKILAVSRYTQVIYTTNKCPGRKNTGVLYKVFYSNGFKEVKQLRFNNIRTNNDIRVLSLCLDKERDLSHADN